MNKRCKCCGDDISYLKQARKWCRACSTAQCGQSKRCLKHVSKQKGKPYANDIEGLLRSGYF